MFSASVNSSINFDDIIAHFANLDRQIQLKLAAFMQERAKAYAPVKTGFLRDNIVIQEGGDTGVRVVSLAPYSHFIEFGYYGAKHVATGRFAPQEDYPITSTTPRGGRIGGERFRARYSGYTAETSAPRWHEPRPFMKPALEDTKKAFPNIVRASWMEVEANPKGSELGVHASQHSGESFGGAGGGLISSLGVGFD